MATEAIEVGSRVRAGRSIQNNLAPGERHGHGTVLALGEDRFRVSTLDHATPWARVRWDATATIPELVTELDLTDLEVV